MSDLSSEAQNLCLSLSVPPNERYWNRLREIGVYVYEGHTVKIKDDSRKYVICYTPYTYYLPGGSSPPKRESESPEVINIVTRKLSDSELDTSFPSDSYRKKIYINQHGQEVACVDTLGNIFFCDFFHYRNMFPEFWDIVKAEGFNTLAFDGLVTNELIDNLKKLSRVKVVELKTEFDKDAYIQEAQILFREHVNVLQASYNAKIKVLKRQLENERYMAFEKESKGISKGIILASDPEFRENWVLKGFKLVYKHKIVPARIKYSGSVYNIPEKDSDVFFVDGLYIRIDKITTLEGTSGCVSYAYARDSYHPNVAESGSVCMGDLEGKPLLEVIKKLPLELLTINLDSAYDQSAKEDAFDIIERLSADEKIRVWHATDVEED